MCLTKTETNDEKKFTICGSCDDALVERHSTEEG